VKQILSAVHAIVQEILLKHKDLSEDQILSLIDEKKKEGRGLLSDEGAARLVAEELLIQTRGSELGRMQVKDLVSGLNDVTISGRVLLAWPPQRFQRRDGTPGRVMRIVIIDGSGRVSCALWDRHVDVAARTGVLQGRIIRIGHAYTRQGLAGDAEVHAGDRSSIEIDPEDLPISDFPQFKDLFISLGKITADATEINTLGIVQTDPRLHSFTKEDRNGSVLRTIIADESGSIPLVAWNERADELKEMKKGSILQIINARTRLDNNSRLELHAERRTQVSILDSAPDYLKVPVARTYKISELMPRSGAVDLNVSVLAKIAPREFKRATSESVKVSSLIVADDSGIASISLWDDKAELVSQLSEGDWVEARGVVVSERMGELRLSLGRSGELQKSTPRSNFAPLVTKLNALDGAKGLLVTEGTVSDEPLVRQVTTEKGENVNVASFTLKDDVGSAKLTLWREQVNLITKLRPGTRIRVTGLRVRPGLSGQVELSSIPLTKIETIEQSVKERPAWEDIRHVIGLEIGLTTWVKGLVLDLVGEQKLVALCETCNSELKAAEDSFHCDQCKSSKTGRAVLVGRLRIDDGTGVTEVSLDSQDPRQYMPGDTQGYLAEMLKAGQSSIILSKDSLTNLLGREVEVYGTAQATAIQGKLEFRAKRVVVLEKL
jgi:ssDNA-binding replication factor A large subunit